MVFATNNLLVLDVEATCWSGPHPAGMDSEVIQVGAVAIDRDCTVYFQGSIFVRPVNSTVSGFCTDLTGITADDLKDARSFAEAMTILKPWKNYPWASWGNYDRSILLRQCERDGVDFPLNPQRHVNIKTIYALGRRLRAEMGVEEALEHAGLVFDGTPHRALDDAWNALRLLGSVMRWPELPKKLPVGRELSAS